MLKFFQNVRTHRMKFQYFNIFLRTNSSTTDQLHVTDNSNEGLLDNRSIVSNDDLHNSIKLSSDTLFELVSPDNSEEITGTHVVQALRKLYNLQKNNK